jgi:hypothetical protein
MSNDIFNQQPKPEPIQTFTSLAQEVGFDLPVESITLPSKGVLYATDHPLCNEHQLEIRSMSAQQEDLLTSPALIKNGTVITQLLRSCLINKSIDPDEMLIGDRNALMIGIRVSGYGAGYSAEIKCPECSEKYENEFSLNNLALKPLNAEPVAVNTNLFKFTLPVTKLVVEFKLLTGKDELEISRIFTAKKKLQTQIDQSMTTRLMFAIVSVNGERNRDKIGLIVRNMRAADSSALRQYINKIEPGVNMKQSVICVHCGESSEVTMPLGASFFWPDLAD